MSLVSRIPRRQTVRRWAGVTVLAALAAAACTGPAVAEPSNEAVEVHAEDVRAWREARHNDLSSDQGWLTLVGLEWLREGENRVGSAESSDVRIPGGPEHWGTVFLQGNELVFEPADGSAVTIAGLPAARTRLVPDREGDPTVVRHENLSFYVVERGSYALRVKDTRAPTLLAFEGVDNYPVDPRWRFETRFRPAEPGRTLAIANVLGQSEAMSVAGTVEFEHEGRTYRLLGLREKGADSLWFLFADRTNGRETYGAGRFVYSNGMPEGDRLVLDFNKSYNPPCAFNDYSTCPLPPQENRLDLAVTAGEKRYRHH